MDSQEVHHLAHGNACELDGLAQGGFAFSILLQGQEDTSAGEEIPDGRGEILLVGLRKLLRKL